MQTILGANGQIGRELALSLKRDFTSDLRLVSRNPQKVNDTDALVRADLMDKDQTIRAVEGSEIVYFTAGLPMNTKMWVERWPTMMRNVIDACVTHNAKMVYFDNTYMYPQTDVPQTEDSHFEPYGEKGMVRANIVQDLLSHMSKGQLDALVCRAPEFYGPGQTQSITNAIVIEPMLSGKTPKVFLRDDMLRTLIYTPDASRAMALLGNTPDAYSQTWHLPCDDNRLTYQAFIELAAQVFGTKANYKVLKQWQLSIAGMFNDTLREAAELLPRYKMDNIFVSDKFKTRFPEFEVTSFKDGLSAIWKEHSGN
ncbi:NAD-dependent epimerase/dehydratase family protein [Litoribrevibacter euphylliae]|uniref:NAD-dependent epimerase/dehydratase family protein n=1 Tax=Litoribrevibacter euphylliae TaxID=1834034 RepID=A0ABV7HC03_9GAMM